MKFGGIIAMICMLCAVSSHAADCVKVNHVCTDHATKIINGFSVTRCWNYRYTYACPSESYTDYCAPLASTPGCSQINSQCSAKGSDGKCKTFTNVYQCGVAVTLPQNVVHLESQYTVAGSELDMSACHAPASDPHCQLLSSSCIAAGQTRNIDGTDVYQDCWEWEYEYACKAGVQYDNCDELEHRCQYQSKTCLLLGQDGHCSHYERSYKCETQTGKTTPLAMKCPGQTYCIHGDCETIDYQPDTNMAKGLAYMNFLKEVGADFDPENISVFSGQGMGCEKTIGGFNNCCKDDGWGQDVSLASCSFAQQDLAIKMQQGQCHYVGAFCSSDSAFGLCLKKQKSYCCYGSKLARIIQQQGKQQLSLGWGGPEAPLCEGLTVDQLESLDFTNIDLSELYPDIEGDLTIPADASVVEDLTKKIEVYYAQ